MTAPASPAPIWELINGFAAYRALCAAIELGVFDHIAAADGESLDLDGLNAAIGAADSADLVLLSELLVALGLLDVDTAGLRLTPASARYLVSTSAASMVELVRLSPGPRSGWDQLTATLRTGKVPAATACELVGFYPSLVRATAPTQAAVARGVAEQLGKPQLIVDLGCGSGAWLSALLIANPGATGIGVDLEEMATLAAATAERAQLGERLTTVVGDYLDVKLPVEQADVVVLGHVLRAESRERAAALVARAVKLAGHAGVVVIADYFRPDPAERGSTQDRNAVCASAKHELVLSLTMRASTNGRGVSRSDITEWAAACGAGIVAEFEPLPRQHVLLLRPHEWSAAR